VSNQDVRTRLRIVLPTAIGALSAMLTIWDIHNWNVIGSMGMAWDTGAPIWPYQTPDILLRLINFPAFLAAMPLSNLLKLMAPAYHLLVFPAGLVWWWLVGLHLDRRTMNREHQRRWAMFVVLAICCGLLVTAAVAEVASVLGWYSKYGGALLSVNKLGVLRFLTPALWSATAAVVVAVASKFALACGRVS
jgi:hypothetical protein